MSARKFTPLRFPVWKIPAHALVAAALSAAVSNVGRAQALPTSTPFIATVDYSQTLRLRDGAETVTRRSWEISRDGQGRMRIDWGSHALIADPVQRLYFDVDVERGTIKQREMVRPEELAARTQASAPQQDTTSSPLTTTALGTKMIEGFLCEGELVTQSLQFENGELDEPIRIETEIWRAVDLRTPVLVLQSNSLGQETRYALTNIRLEEPSPAEFRPPEGFVKVPNHTAGLEDVAAVRPGVGLP